MAAAVILLLLPLAGPHLERLLTTTETRVIGGSDLPVTPEQGRAWIANLTALSLARESDSSDSPARSRLILLENGVPLRAHALHDEVRRGEAGAFSHWGHGIYFCTTDGSDPRANGRTYTVVFPQLRVLGFGTVMPWLQAMSVALLVALGSVAAVFPASPWGQVATARRTAFLLLGLVAAALFAEAWASRGRYGITPDSDSYTAPPGLSIRPPVYYGLMCLVADPDKVRAEVRQLAESGKSNLVMESHAPSQVRRVIFAQRLLLCLALVFCSIALAALIGTPWAAAIVLLLGKTQGKVTDGTLWAWIIAGLLLVPLAAGLVREAGWRRWRAVPLLALGAVVLYPALVTALERPLMPGQVDLLMSETLAVAFLLATLGALAFGCAGRGAWWIVVAAMTAGAAYLTRPAAIYCLPVVGAAALLQAWRGSRLAWRWPLVACLMMVLAAVLPGKIKRWAGATGAELSMLRWSLASYALTVARPLDVVYVKDGNARYVLEDCLPRRDQIRATYPIPPDLPYSPEVYRLGQYMYQVVLPVSQRFAEEKFPQDRRAQVAMWNRLLGDMALPLYRVHARELAGIFLSSYRYMMQQGTRLTRPWPFWGVMFCAAALAGLAWNRTGLAAALCLAAHALHLAVICMFDQPLERYVFATEFCAVLGIWLAVAAASRAAPAAEREVA